MSPSPPRPPSGPVGEAPVRPPGRAAARPIDLFDLDRHGLVALLVEFGEPPYRGRQVHAWLVRGVDDPQLMTDLPKDLRARLAERVAPVRPELVRHQVADGGATHKLLLRLPSMDAGGEDVTIETVLMLHPRRGGGAGRATVCVSTQAGCAMGCPFCATGQAGLSRQLRAGEIVRQVVVVEALLRGGGLLAEAEHPDHVTNVVFMGMGEPLANLDATAAAIRWLHDPEGRNLSARSLTVSTVGLVPGIRRLAGMGLPLTLAVSLHAADDRLRDELVPINRVHPLGDLLDAVEDYERATRRRVSFEFVLIDGVNDSDEQAQRLARLATTQHRAPRRHVNLIPLNPTPGVPRWREPSPDRVRAFADVLRAARVPVTVRGTRGRDVDAACGQLLAEYRLGAGRTLPVAVGAAERVAAVVGGGT